MDEAAAMSGASDVWNALLGTTVRHLSWLNLSVSMNRLVWLTRTPGVMSTTAEVIE